MAEIKTLCTLSIEPEQRSLPGAQAACAQPHEDGADELPEGRSIDGVQLLLVTVAQVVTVEGGAGQTHALRGLVIIQEPLQLWRTAQFIRQRSQCFLNYWVLWKKDGHRCGMTTERSTFFTIRLHYKQSLAIILTSTFSFIFYFQKSGENGYVWYINVMWLVLSNN